MTIGSLGVTGTCCRLATGDRVNQDRRITVKKLIVLLSSLLLVTLFTTPA